MPLFHRNRTQAERLAKQRDGLRTGLDINAALGELLADLDLSADLHPEGWVVQFGPIQVLLVGLRKEGMVSGIVPIGHVTAPEGMRRLLHANLDHTLGYVAGGDPDEIDGRVKVPADPFDRDGVAHGLQAFAELLDTTRDEDMSDLVRRLREGRGSLDEPSVARERATRALETALSELDVPGAEREDGIWRIETERGDVEAILADTGASWMLMHELRHERGDQDPEVLRWLLDASGARGARLGLADLPDGPHLFVTLVLPATSPSSSSVAYGLANVLNVGDEMDRQNGYA
jgi:hypothetical protein